MSIDINSESLLSLAEAAKTLPTRPSVSTLHRWRLRGVRGVTLETVLLGGRRLTSAEALGRFANAATAAANGPMPARTSHPEEREVPLTTAAVEPALTKKS